MNNLKRANKPKFIQITPAIFTILGGAVGWVETDVSASTGINTQKIFVVLARDGGASGLAGVRKTGSIIDNKAVVYSSFTLMTHVNSVGHVDFYRNAGDMIYTFIGYLL